MISIIVAHFFILLTVISQSHEKPNGLENRQIRGKDANIARSYFFDVELVEMLTREQQDKNVVLSPISVKLVLGMLMEGSVGETREQIRRALRLSKIPQEARTTMKTWIDAFKKPSENTTLNLANQIFISQNYKLNEKFKEIVIGHYGGNVSKLDMSDSVTAAGSINEWVQKETHGIIEKLVDESQIGHDTYGILASAVYFKGNWKKPFTSKTNKCFYKTENKCTNTVFMQKRDRLMYAHINSINADVIELPYKDERFSMMVLIPRESVEELNRDLPREQLHRLLAALKPTDLHVQIPRFTAEFEQDLVPVLSQLRIRDAFTKNANISGILQGTNESFSISNLFHSAKIVVDEEGSEAAAATEALIAPLIGVDSIIADKPFIFFIKDSLSNAILFAGRVSDPEQAVDESVVVGNRDREEVSPASNVIEIPISKTRPGPPAPLGPRRPGRPNGFHPSSSFINFTEEEIEEITQPPKPPRSVITTTTPYPFIRVKPTNEPEDDDETMDIEDTTTLAKPNQEPNVVRMKPEMDTNPNNKPEDFDQEFEYRRRYYPFRVLFFTFYGAHHQKIKKFPEQIVFNS